MIILFLIINFISAGLIVNNKNTIFLIRHAEKSRDYFNRYCKDGDAILNRANCIGLIEPLNIHGLSRAEQFANYFTSFNINKIFILNFKQIVKNIYNDYMEYLYVRPWQTVYPLHKKLNTPINTNQINLDNLLDTIIAYAPEDSKNLTNCADKSIKSILKQIRKNNILICSMDYSLRFIIKSLGNLQDDCDAYLDLKNWPSDCFDIVWILNFNKHLKLESIVCTGQFIFDTDSGPYQLLSKENKTIFYDHTGTKRKINGETKQTLKAIGNLKLPINTLIAQTNETLEEIRDNYNCILKKYNNSLPASLYEYLENYKFVKFTGTN